MPAQDIDLDTTEPKSDFATEFEEGLAALAPFLRAFACSLAGNRDLGEDLAQDAVASAWQFRHSFTMGTNLKAWLFAILRNEFYSHQRRAWRQMPWTAELSDSIAAAPGEQHWNIELSDTACAMNGLPDSQREALILVGVCGFSYEETALLLMSALGTVKSRVGRARHALTKILDCQKSRRIELRPADGMALAEWLEQVDRLRECACQTLDSGNFSGFHTFRTTPRMAVHVPAAKRRAASERVKKLTRPDTHNPSRDDRTDKRANAWATKHERVTA